MTSHNLVCVFIMIVRISFVILIAMVTILAGQYGLPSYLHTYIYKMEKYYLLAIRAVIICMSTEPSSHQHSETVITILKLGLWTALRSTM